MVGTNVTPPFKIRIPESVYSEPQLFPVRLPQREPDKKKCRNPTKIFHEKLTILFRGLGAQVARYPSYFIMFPVFLTILAVTGLQHIKTEDNPEILFYPLTGRALDDRKVIETNFPINFTGSFLPFHMTRPNGFSRVLVTPKQGNSIFTKEIWDDVVQLDEDIRMMKTQWSESEFVYESMCATFNTECYKNRVLDLQQFIPEIENGSMYVNYPIMLYPLILPFDFGGLEIDEEEGLIKDAKALSLGYFLKQDTEQEKEMSLLWEQNFLDMMSAKNFEHIKTAYFAARSKQDEMLNNTSSIKPYSAVTGVIMALFTICSVLTSDWVRGKFFIAFIGLASAGMSTITAFGALMYMGVPFIAINRIIPFLMLGIGVDDMFVVLASWRRTRIQDPVLKRLSDTYVEAGVSITITSLTNILSFSVGTRTPIIGVQIFCIYTTFSVFITYLYHLTFFGACLAIAGYLEGNQKHAITCKSIKSKSQSKNDSGCFRFWCAGGIDHANPWHPTDNQPHTAMKTFRDVLGKMLTYPLTKALVLIAFICYFGGAVYGCTKLKEGLNRKHVIRYDSYAYDYYTTEDELFRKYPYAIQVVITGNITYSDINTETEVMTLHREFEGQPYAAESIFTQSWMRAFYQYLRIREELRNQITDEKSFIKILREEYLSGEYNPMALDIKFNDDFTKIEASRFIIHTYEITDSIKEVEMVAAFRDIAEKSSLNVRVFNPNFVLFDQITMVKPITIEAIWMAVIAMLLVSLVFIPNPWCSILVGLAILSIETGVVGYMALWGVYLDQISMINLIMCIGFSVDFSAHISYAYLTAKVNTTEERIKECLYSLGLPIIQGGLSTLVCICTFILVPSYVYVTFFKIVFIVVLFAILHGLFLIPVLLSLFGPPSSTPLPVTEIRIPRVKLALSEESTSQSTTSTDSGRKVKRKERHFQKRPEPEGSCDPNFVGDVYDNKERGR